MQAERRGTEVTAHPQDQDMNYMWLVLAGGILGSVIIAVAVVIVFVTYRHKKLSKYPLEQDKTLGKQPYRHIKLISSTGKGSHGYSARHSSADSCDSPPLADLHYSEEALRAGVFTAQPVQPKTLHNVSPSVSVHSLHQGLLGLPQSDVYATSDEEENRQVSNTSGRIWFSVTYDEPEKKLKVHLIKARYLKGRGMTYEPRDPFVRVYVLPDESHFQQSKVRKRTLSPRFNETFSFEMNPEEYADRTLRLSVYDIDKRNVRHSLGHAFIPLAKVDVTSNSVLAKNLELVSQNKAHIGELQFSLCCNPYSERIKVNVMRAKHLVFRGLDADHSDMYVKVELYFGPKLMKSKETSRQRVCESPNIYQNFSFGITGKHFDSCSISLEIMVHKVPASPYPSQPGTPSSSRSPADAGTGAGEDVPYGRIVVGPFMFARGEQLQHWQDMLSNPRTPIERWHSLSAMT